MDSIVSIDAIKRKARQQHADGYTLDRCPFWPTSEAAKTWRAEWRLAEAEKQQVAA